MSEPRVWSASSQRVLDTLCPELQEVMGFLLITFGDLSLIAGYRDEEDQNKAFSVGASKLRYPNSKHNQLPSRAVDFQPYPMPNIDAVDPDIRERERRKLWASLAYFAGGARVYGYASGWKLRWGGDWDMDGSLVDNNFDDLYHLEMVKW